MDKPRQKTCPSCATPLLIGDHFCRGCGARIRPDQPVIVIDSHWKIFIAMATIGPFAIPLVWRSENLSESRKHLWTIVIAAVTVAVCAIFYFLVQMSIELFIQIVRLGSEL